MTLALTKVEAFGREIDEPLVKRFNQTLVLQGTGATTDLTYDFASYSGTFWTAVGATQPGITALKALKDISIKALTLLSVQGEALLLREPMATGATLAAGQYKISAIGTGTALHVPSLAFYTGEGPTSWVIEINWDLKNGESPEAVSKSA